VTGLIGDDVICGDEGNDNLLGGAGFLDKIFGGPGDDTTTGALTFQSQKLLPLAEMSFWE
jgi:RTX calcium-binding nonapeptide repeat (4 copies)